MKVKLLSCVRLSATPWTIAYQVPPSMGFSRQECWGGLPFPSPGDLPNPGIEPGFPALQADALTSEPPGRRKDGEESIKNLGTSDVHYIKYINNKDPLYSTENYSKYFVITYNRKESE